MLLTLIAYISLIMSCHQSCFSLRDGIKFSSWLRYAWSKWEKEKQNLFQLRGFHMSSGRSLALLQNWHRSAGSWLSYGHKLYVIGRLFLRYVSSKIQELKPNKGSFTWLQMPQYIVLFSLSTCNKTLPIHCRDSVLLKTGNWMKKIEVKRALKSEDISINLISSDYGRLIGMLLIQKQLHKNFE